MCLRGICVQGKRSRPIILSGRSESKDLWKPEINRFLHSLRSVEMTIKKPGHERPGFCYDMGNGPVLVAERESLESNHLCFGIHLLDVVLH